MPVYPGAFGLSPIILTTTITTGLGIAVNFNEICKVEVEVKQDVIAGRCCDE